MSNSVMNSTRSFTGASLVISFSSLLTTTTMILMHPWKMRMRKVTVMI